MTGFPELPPLGERLADDPLWRYSSAAGAGEVAARLLVWAAPADARLAVVTELGLGVSVTDLAESIWLALRAAWPGRLILLKHWPAAELPGGEHLDRVLIAAGAGNPNGAASGRSPDRARATAQAAAWMERHGRRASPAAP